MRQICLPANLLLTALLAISCGGGKKDLEITRKGDIWFRNAGISLRFDNNMYCNVYFANSDTALNVSGTGDLSKPSHFLIVNGRLVKDFAVDYKNIRQETIESCFGKGKTLTLTGIAEQPGIYKIEKTLTVKYFDKYPNTAIFSATYKNLGNSPIRIDSSYAAYFRMDASQLTPGSNPYDFWSFQGSSLAWGVDYIIRITDGFRQENWMGVQPETKTGGGVPIIDLWNRRAGLSIAHLDTTPQLVSFPVETAPDKRVNMSLSQAIDTLLLPGATYTPLTTAVTAHHLDYFDPLHTYASLLADEGLKRKKPSEEAYAPIWCGWGYLTNFTLNDIYQTLPKLRELGIHWVVIDDRWWDKYGDWNPRKYTFPGGEKQVRQFVDSLHHQGFKVKIWWAPTPVQPPRGVNPAVSVDPGMARIAKEHPDWLIMDKNGNYPRDCRGMYQFCPSVPAVQEYMKQLATRFIGKWGFDGHKLDAYYVVPPCYNPAHHHKSPDESYRDLPKLLKIIYETSKSIKPASVTEVCNCGTTQDYFQSIYTDQPVISDPTSTRQARQRIKVFKALWGSDAPVYTDHVEHIRPGGDMNDKSDTAKVGDDFASSMGPGGVVGTKFTWPTGPANMQLSGKKEQHWEKWLALYHRKLLSKGNYLNLYDIVYDVPETHVIQKGDTLYYACYAGAWTGKISLRGLAGKLYRVVDYEHNQDLGTVEGPTGILDATFKQHLLLECTPAK